MITQTPLSLPGERVGGITDITYSHDASRQHLLFSPPDGVLYTLLVKGSIPPKGILYTLLLRGGGRTPAPDHGQKEIDQACSCR